MIKQVLLDVSVLHVQGKRKWYDVCEEANKQLIQRLVNVSNLDKGIEWAACGGHMDLVHYFVEKGAQNWDWGMEGAAWATTLSYIMSATYAVRFFLKHNELELKSSDFLLDSATFLTKSRFNALAVNVSRYRPTGRLMPYSLQLSRFAPRMRRSTGSRFLVSCIRL